MALLSLDSRVFFIITDYGYNMDISKKYAAKLSFICKEKLVFFTKEGFFVKKRDKSLHYE